ncbi:hypothetical protein MmazTMA_19020 [Methanosarcina mazei]|nr:hypothetical protein MmazTMA_19020 [Methanosarcina mazei]
MHELPVAKKIKKLGSYVMGKAIANRNKYRVWNNIQIRENGQKSYYFQLLPSQAQSQANKNTHSQVRY